jgi:uncharacterized protein (DUF1015 family)
MVEIRPFKATIMNPEMDIAKLICPVYDTIDAANYQRFANEKNNIIHVTTRRKDVDRDEFIDVASKELERFKKTGVLVEREKPALYIYGIMFSLQQETLAMLSEKDRRSQYFVFGLVCLVKVEELGKGSVVGHENIFEINSNERYRLMKASMMNFSPIAAEYNMSGHDLNNLFEEYLGFKRPDYIQDPDKLPIVDVSINGSRHFLWEIIDDGLIQKITKMVSGSKLLVLDGHHRYTASNLLREKDGIEYTMMMLMEGGDRALLLLPWHRTVRNVSDDELATKIRENFSLEWQGVSNDEGFYSHLRERISVYDVRLGMYDGNRFSILRANEFVVREISKKRGEVVGLDLIILHDLLINPSIRGKPEEDVSFNASPKEAIEKVDDKGYKVAFILHPFSIRDVERKAFEEHKNFPQKSTLFLPKVAEGIVMRAIK